MGDFLATLFVIAGFLFFLGLVILGWAGEIWRRNHPDEKPPEWTKWDAGQR